MFNSLISYIKKKLTVNPSYADVLHFKYFSIIMILFAAILLTSQIAAIKLVDVFGITFTGGFIIYPFTYVLNCITVEVYGYKNARLTIWCGFILCFIFIFFIDLVVLMPPSPYWHLNEEFKQILMPGNRIVFASLVSFLVADFINSYLIAKSKAKACPFINRIIKASVLSIFIGVILFIGLAYYNVIPNYQLIQLMVFAFIKKLLFQMLLFPITAYAIYVLKRLEGVDLYDYSTKFTPFSLDNVYDLELFRLKRKDNEFALSRS